MAEDAVRYKLVVVGGSAGSLEVILKILPLLPNRSGAAFVIVVHRKNDPDSILTNLIAARTGMTVKEVEDKEPLLPDHIYIAPPDYHLLAENEELFSLDSSEKVYYSRPSIDVTFNSIAEIFGPSAIGVLLSGANADGAEGLSQIKSAGGLTIVQDPKEASVSYMPQQAIDLFSVDYIADTKKMGEIVNRLNREAASF